MRDLTTTEIDAVNGGLFPLLALVAVAATLTACGSSTGTPTSPTEQEQQQMQQSYDSCLAADMGDDYCSRYKPPGG